MVLIVSLFHSGVEQELTNKPLVDLTNKTNWQQTGREHRYKYTGDNGEGGGRQSQGQVKQGVTQMSTVTLVEAVEQNGEHLCVCESLPFLEWS